MNKGYRSIVIDNQKWKYKLGGTFVVARNLETKEKKLISYSKLTGMDWNDIERAVHKRYFCITPKIIANWLQNNYPKIENRA